MKAHKTTLSVRELQKDHRTMEKSENHRLHRCETFGVALGDARLYE